MSTSPPTTLRLATGQKIGGHEVEGSFGAPHASSAMSQVITHPAMPSITATTLTPSTSNVFSPRAISNHMEPEFSLVRDVINTCKKNLNQRSGGHFGTGGTSLFRRQAKPALPVPACEINAGNSSMPESKFFQEGGQDMQSKFASLQISVDYSLN